MRKFLLVAAASILIPFGGIQASVSGDLANGISLDQVVANASLDNLSIEDLIEQVAAVDKGLVAGLVANLVAKALESGSDVSTVLAAAVKAAPAQAEAIAKAAIVQVAAKDQSLVAGIVALAIDSGVDASLVLATAIDAAPNQKQSISDVAQAKGVDNAVLEAQGLGVAGVDPNQGTPPAATDETPAAVTEGVTPGSDVGAPATPPVTAPTFSSSGGTGGGGTGSPSA